MFYSRFLASDCCYILDVNEMLTNDPRPMLIKAMIAKISNARMASVVLFH
jgi:hypothetical protein